MTAATVMRNPIAINDAVESHSPAINWFLNAKIESNTRMCRTNIPLFPANISRKGLNLSPEASLPFGELLQCRIKLLLRERRPFGVGEYQLAVSGLERKEVAKPPLAACPEYHVGVRLAVRVEMFLEQRLVQVRRLYRAGQSLLEYLLHRVDKLLLSAVGNRYVYCVLLVVFRLLLDPFHLFLQLIGKDVRPADESYLHGKSVDDMVSRRQYVVHFLAEVLEYHPQLPLRPCLEILERQHISSDVSYSALARPLQHRPRFLEPHLVAQPRPLHELACESPVAVKDYPYVLWKHIITLSLSILLSQLI